MDGHLKDLLNVSARDLRNGKFAVGNIYLRVSSDNAQDMVVANNVSMRIMWEIIASAPNIQALSMSAHAPWRSAFHVEAESMWSVA